MTAAIHAGDMAPALLVELKKADQIILAMLNAMTSAQKSKVHAKLDAEGISGEGMTRYHERRAVIDATAAALCNSATVRAGPDERQHAIDATGVVGVAISFINDNIHPVLSALTVLADLDDIDQHKAMARLDQIKCLSKLGRQLVEEAAGHLESEERGLKDRLAGVEVAA